MGHGDRVCGTAGLLRQAVEGDQKRLVQDNPQANKKAPIFYVGQTTLHAWQRYEDHLNEHWESKWVRKSLSLNVVFTFRTEFSGAYPART
jgi:hypothetical protein